MIDRLKESLSAVKSKIQRLNSAFTDGSIDGQEFKELKNPLVTEKAVLEQKIVGIEQTKLNRLEPLKTFIFEANQASKWVKEENWLRMKSFLQKVGSNRLLHAQTLTISFKKPSSLLAETVVALQGINVDSAQSLRWWRRGELNPRP